MPHPSAGQSGGGIFFCPEVGQAVLIARGPMEKPFIVQGIPERELYFNTEGVENTSINTTPYPQNMKPGEICVKGPSGSRLDLFRKGNISFSANIGKKSSNLELSTVSKGLFTRVNNTFKFTEAGRSVEGVIRRNVARGEREQETNTFNFLDGEAYDRILRTIGRSPKSGISYRTTTLSAPLIRNPSLVEKRSIVYEYAESYNVTNLENEASAMESGDKNQPGKGFKNITRNRSARQERRTDVLNLNLNNYNHLIEKVEGTLVDIYGNVLDINRNIIPVPNADSIKTGNASAAKSGLNNIYAYLRRSVKMHYEINSRKKLSGNEPSKSSTGDNNGKDFSRFSIDIDGEGLTKINIPASSETGNIPVLGRYVNTRDDENPSSGTYRDSGKVDVKMLPFSKGGPTISNSTYKPPVDGSGTITAGTAHHDLTTTASSIFSKGKHGSGEVMTTSLNNSIEGGGANAGGRSLNVNLDGSAEISIGADSVDNKSLVMDLAGGLISHFGRNKQGRSITHQSDGDVIMQIGDDSRPGRLEIHLARSGGEPQKIIIDETGITVAIEGNTLFTSKGDFSIVAKGQLVLEGTTIWLGGGADEAVAGTRAAKPGKRFVLPNGNIVI